MKSDDWQPIETAPTDGTHLLLCATIGSMIVPKPVRVVGWYARGWWTYDRVLSHVTNWMPLPALPVRREG